MCGISGISESISDNIINMTEANRSRGPDDIGYWNANDCELSFGHTRLAILDLSSTGHQPMLSHSGRFVITYNGEIYNAAKIKTDIETIEPDTSWKGESDTETLVMALETLGVEETLKSLDGMFAFAAFDQQKKELFLARDYFGEKPLFFSWINGKLSFSSSIRSLEKVNGFNKKVLESSIYSLLQLGFTPGKETIYEGVFSLPPGTYLRLSERELHNQPSENSLRNKITSYKYCCPKQDNSIINSIYTELTKSVKSRFLSHVPAGIFLSGGIDSSLITAIAKNELGMTPSTFTLGFKNKAYDESGNARIIASHLKTNHYEFIVDDNDVFDHILNMGSIIDEPFGDTSTIPTSMLAKFAKAHISVALTGDGGDELFGGYTRYIESLKMARLRKIIPNKIFNSLKSKKSNLLKLRNELVKKDISKTPVLNKINKYFYRFLSNSTQELDMSFIGPGIYSTASKDIISDILKNSLSIDDGLLSSMLKIDREYYLPDNILVKSDRCSMAYGLETRSPFLNYELLNLSTALPDNDLLGNGKGKVILRKLLSKHLPESIYNNQKRGFSPPLGEWLRGPLYSWSDELIAIILQKNHSFIDNSYTKNLWDAHCRKRIDASTALWPLIMLSAWLNRKGI